jgi:CRP-like cAMP-binding protein
MLRNAKIDLLRRVTLFSGCSKRELGEIARITDEIDFPAGKVLIRQGDPGRQLFIVVEGTVDVTRDGKKLPADRGGSEFFGEISLVSNSPTTATVETTTPVRALVITPRDFKALLGRQPTIQRRVLHSFSERLAPYVV